ncbi:filamin-A-like isoform X2 [Clytia hemisphaerica]|uniref:Uncharacterized protein n=1 Tax=Clytia hemisphaerica TaxID=252671 RepID=A0A7M5XEJ0_9CNID|eukprot:TCONS_00011198-protein
MVTMQEIINEEMEEIANADVESNPERVVAKGYGLVTGIASQPNSFKLDAREAGYGDFDVVIKGASRASIEYIEEEEALYKIKYFVELPGLYQIEIKYDLKHIPGSPFTAKVIDGSTMENQSICKTEGTNSTESFSTINETAPSDEEPPTANNNGKSLPIFADIKLPSGKTIIGTCVQNAAGKVTVNFPREETGTYTVTLKHKKSGKILPGSPYEVSVQAKPQKTTMTAYGTGLKEASIDKTNCFTVFGSKGVEITDVCILVFGPYSCKLKVVQNDWDSFDILYEVKRSGSYQFYIHENGRDIPGSPFIVIAKGTSQNSTQILSSYVATVWHGQPSTNLKTITDMTSPSGQKVSHSLARKGKHVMEIRFLPSQNGIFILDLFKGQRDMEQVFNIRVEALPSSNESVFQISGDGLHTATVNKPSSVKIHSVLPSLKSFSIEFDGPGAVDIVQQKSDKSSSGCAIEYVGRVPGSYAMSIKYDGFHVEGSPFDVTILPAHGMISDVPFNMNSVKQQKSSKPNAKACIVQGDQLHRAYLDKAKTFTIDTSKAGEGVLMAGFHTSLSATEVKCKHLGNSVYEVQYMIGEIGLHKLSVFWSGENIVGSPFEIIVIDENNNAESSSC